MKAETIIAVLLSISMMTASVEPAHAVDSYRHTTKAFNVWRFASFLCCRFRFMFFMFNYVRPTDGCSGIRRNTTNWVVGLWNCRNKQEEQLKVFTLQRVGERKWQKNQFLGLPFSYLPMSCLNFLVYHFQVCHWTHFSYVPMLTKWFGLMCILNHLPVTQTTLLLLVDLHAASRKTLNEQSVGHSVKNGGSAPAVAVRTPVNLSSRWRCMSVASMSGGGGCV